MQPQAVQILRQLKPDDAGDIRVKRLKYKNKIIADKYPNNIVLLVNNRVFRIHKIFLPAACNIETITMEGKILKKKTLYLHSLVVLKFSKCGEFLQLTITLYLII